LRPGRAGDGVAQCGGHGHQLGGDERQGFLRGGSPGEEVVGEPALADGAGGGPGPVALDGEPALRVGRGAGLGRGGVCAAGGGVAGAGEVGQGAALVAAGVPAGVGAGAEVGGVQVAGPR
jgi:hypothetical protein